MELPFRPNSSLVMWPSGLHEVRHGLLEAIGVAQHVGRLADDLGVRMAVAQNGLQGVEHAGGQLAQVHAR